MLGNRAIIEENTGKRTLVLNEPDDSVRDALKVLLEGEGWDVRCVHDCESLKAAIAGAGVAALICESSLPDCRPEEVLEFCSGIDMPMIFTGHDLPLQSAVDLIRQGARDYLDKPFPQARLLDLLNGLK